MQFRGDALRPAGQPGAGLVRLVGVMAARIRALIANRPFMMLFAAGAASTLAMAPFHFWPVLFLTLPTLFWALDDVADKPSPSHPFATASWRGWAFGFGYHLVGLHWIGFSFLVQAERFAALMPFAIAALTASLGLFLGAAGAAYVAARRPLPSGMPRIVLLALLVMVAEWLRGHILTGFPWNVLGYALTMPLPLMQWAGLAGIYVLTAITVISLTAPFVILSCADGNSALKPWRTIALVTVAPIGLAALYGIWQLQANPTRFNRDVRLRLVQPSFTQREKFDPSKRGAIFLRHLELSRRGFEPGSKTDAESRPTHIFWPEAAIPFFVRRDRGALAALANALPDDVQVIAGTFRINASPDLPNAQVPKDFRVYNTAITFAGDGSVRSIYDKIHLVPFGEYLPAQKVLNALGFENLTRTKGGLALGRSPRRLMHIAGLPPVSMLICYEAIFPDELVQGPARPDLLVNLTNDAWFGETTGPAQHLHQTRLRAVEQGRPLVRSANNGISAIVDPMGRIVSSLALNEVGNIDSSMPLAAKTPVYGRYGRYIEAIVLLLMLVYLALKGWRPGTRA